MFGFFKKQEPSTTIDEIKTKPFGVDLSAHRATLNVTDPYVSEIKSTYGYNFGERNLYPQQLLRFYSTSPIHCAAINYKALLTSGEGIQTLDANLSLEKRIDAEQFKHFLNRSIEGLTYDMYLHSRFYLEVTWNPSYTKIINLKRIPAESIRIFDVDKTFEATEYIYCFDWRQPGRFGTTKYAKFNPEDKKNRVQLYEYQQDIPGKKLYTLPSYRSCLDWVSLDSQMGVYHTANISNSLNPSLIVKFYSTPDTDEKKREIRDSLVNSFGGAANAGRVMTMFSPDKDSAPDVEQLEPSKLDKSFLSLTDTIQRQILYAHNINPDLLGLKTPGSLGTNGGQLEEIKNQFKYSVIRPVKKIIQDEINYLASFNGLSNCFVLADVNQ